MERARGALLGTFVGDALGMPWETQPPEAVPATVEMEEARRGRGTYTDDTEMAINLAESLAECGGVDEERLAMRFLEGHDPERGYGGGTLEVFRLWRAGVPVTDAAQRVFAGRGSAGNGAAMRIAPVAVMFAGSPELRGQAERSARVTHAHPAAVDGAVVQAAAVAAALRGEPPLEAALAAARTGDLRERLRAVEDLLTAHRAAAGAPSPAQVAAPSPAQVAAPSPAQVAARLGNTALAAESVPAAIYAAVAHDDFEPAVRFAIRCGGDTDTIGAMAGAIAGAAHGAGAIPLRWLDALEDGERGRTYVDELARRLVDARPGPGGQS